MEKKYQVFVSSTYQDLQQERQEVMQALLELDCIPVGMELFPAADDDQWTLIKGLINNCDYYILIIGGRYGSISSIGKSYTQMEYEYAIEQNIPVISFIHKEPGKIPAEKTESTDEGKAKLKNFIELAKQKMCQFWTSPSDLGSKVSRSLVKLIKTKPRIGWVKANYAEQEIFKLKEENKKLLEKILKLNLQISSNPFQQSENLFQSIYIPYLKQIFIYLDVQDYTNWTYNLAVAPETVISFEQYENLKKLVNYIQTRVTYPEYDEWNNLMYSLKYLVNDLLKILNTHIEIRGNWYTIEKFYKRERFNPNYREDLNAYFEEIYLLADLTLELTRLSNYILEKIRTIIPKFLLEVGILIVDETMDINFVTYREDELSNISYSNIEEFVKIRSTRNKCYDRSAKLKYYPHN